MSREFEWSVKGPRIARAFDITWENGTPHGDSATLEGDVRVHSSCGGDELEVTVSSGFNLIGVYWQEGSYWFEGDDSEPDVFARCVHILGLGLLSLGYDVSSLKENYGFSPSGHEVTVALSRADEKH